MKQYPPIVFFTLLLLIACSRQNEKKNTTISKPDAYGKLYLEIESNLEDGASDLSESFKQLKKVATNDSYKGGYFYLKGKYFADNNKDSSFVNF